MVEVTGTFLNQLAFFVMIIGTLFVVGLSNFVPIGVGRPTMAPVPAFIIMVFPLIPSALALSILVSRMHEYNENQEMWILIGQTAMMFIAWVLSMTRIDSRMGELSTGWTPKIHRARVAVVLFILTVFSGVMLGLSMSGKPFWRTAGFENFSDGSFSEEQIGDMMETTETDVEAIEKEQEEQWQQQNQAPISTLENIGPFYTDEQGQAQTFKEPYIKNDVQKIKRAFPVVDEPKLWEMLEQQQEDNRYARLQFGYLNQQENTDWEIKRI